MYTDISDTNAIKMAIKKTCNYANNRKSDKYQGKYYTSLDINIIPYNEKKYKGDKKKIALSHKILR